MSSLPLDAARLQVAAIPERYEQAVLPSPRPSSTIDALRSSLGGLACRVASASDLPARRDLERVSSGVSAIDDLAGGLPRGAVSELAGAASTGRTSVLLAAIAQTTARGEVCALIDVTDSFDPESAAASGVDLTRVLWVRCNGELPTKKDTSAKFSTNDFGGHDYIGRAQERDSRQHFAADAAQQTPGLLPEEFAGRTWKKSPRKLRNDELSRRLEQALRATDLLLQSGGFGMVVLDMGDLPLEVARRVPLTTWYRFRRAVENTPTSLLVVEIEALAQSCAALTLRLTRAEIDKNTVAAPTNANLLHGITVAAELVRAKQEHSPWQKKPAQRFVAHAMSHVRAG